MGQQNSYINILSTKCDICGEDISPGAMIRHWKEKHPQYYRLHVRVWIFSGAAILGGLSVLTITTRNLGIPSWMSYLVQAIIIVILVLAVKWYLMGKRESMRKVNEKSPGAKKC